MLFSFFFIYRQIYGQVDKLLQQNVRVGGVAVLPDENRFIYYLVTKEFSYEQPSYESLAQSLNSMRKHMVFELQFGGDFLCFFPVF